LLGREPALAYRASRCRFALASITWWRMPPDEEVEMVRFVPAALLIVLVGVLVAVAIAADIIGPH